MISAAVEAAMAEKDGGDLVQQARPLTADHQSVLLHPLRRSLWLWP